MYKGVIIFIGVLAIAGCQTTPLTAVSYQEQQTIINQILARCHKAGAKQGTQAEKDCFVQEVHAEQYKRSRNAHMLQQYIELQKASAANRATCVQAGNMVHCY